MRDAIEVMRSQVEGTEYKPSALFVIIDNELIDILDPENKDIVDRYINFID